MSDNILGFQLTFVHICQYSHLHSYPCFAFDDSMLPGSFSSLLLAWSLCCWKGACTGCSIRSIWGEISRDSSNICHHLPPRTDPWHRLLLAPWHPQDLPGPPLHHLHACLHPLHLCFQRKVVQKKANRGEQEERWKGGEAEYEEPFVTFSAMFTLANVLFSLVGNVVYCLSLTHNAGWDKTWGVDGQGFHTLSVDDDQEYQLTLLWVAKLHFTGTERNSFWYFYQLLIKISNLGQYSFDKKINKFW